VAADIEFSLVVPAYEESERIQNTLRDYYESMTGRFKEFEIIVVCDGPDCTREVVMKTSKSLPRIRLLSYPGRLGKGGALTEGFKASRGRLIGFTDADESVRPASFMKLVRIVEQGKADAAVASRYVEGARILRPQPLGRRIFSRVFNVIVRILFGIKCKDTQCGAKVFTRKAVESVLPLLTCNGFEIDVELLWRLKSMKKRILEIPVSWGHKDNGVFNMNFITGYRMLKNLVKAFLFSI
jgi:glycosyltransferase involved in cell wall biosynthesis